MRQRTWCSMMLAAVIGLVPTIALGQDTQMTQEEGGQQQAEPIRVEIVEPEMPDFKNRFSFGPLGLLLGIGNFTYERAFGPKGSLEIAPWGIYFGFGDDDIYGFSLGIGGAFYLTGDAPQGLRVSAMAAPGFLGSSAEGTDTVFMLGIKFLFGYNWVWRSGFSLGLGGGIQYVHFDTSEIDSSLNGILPALEFNLGFAW